MNNKKRQSSLFKQLAVVEFFRTAPIETGNMYADNKPYMTFKRQTEFYGYKVVKAEKTIDLYTNKYWFNWCNCKAVKI